MKAMLVYQNSIANVFKVRSFNLSDYGRHAKRIFQGTYHDAQYFCHGLAASKWIVRTAACDELGDITNSHWSENIDDSNFSSGRSMLSLN